MVLQMVPLIGDQEESSTLLEIKAWVAAHNAVHAGPSHQLLLLRATMPSGTVNYQTFLNNNSLIAPLHTDPTDARVVSIKLPSTT